MLGVDDAFPISDLADILPGLLEGRERVYTTLGEHPDFDRDLLGWVKTIRGKTVHGAQPPGEFVVLAHLLHDLRLYKSAHELKLMRQAAAITTGAHIRAMRSARPGGTEAELEAEIIHEFMRNGARFPAYPCIVGAGKNACVMHYVRNDGPLKDGDLVLVDAGAEYRYYATDVTRTFPVNGRYSAQQRAVYDIVLRAAARGDCRGAPGQPVRASRTTPRCETMVEGLVELGLLDGDVRRDHRARDLQTILRAQEPDTGSASTCTTSATTASTTRVATLEPGMVLTVEPGIYVPDDDVGAGRVPRHRHPHRRRRAGHARRRRGADGRRAEEDRRRRSGDARPVAGPWLN